MAASKYNSKNRIHSESTNKMFKDGFQMEDGVRLPDVPSFSPSRIYTTDNPYIRDKSRVKGQGANPNSMPYDTPNFEIKPNPYDF
jgi:hypothetical protein